MAVGIKLLFGRVHAMAPFHWTAMQKASSISSRSQTRCCRFSCVHFFLDTNMLSLSRALLDMITPNDTMLLAPRVIIKVLLGHSLHFNRSAFFSDHLQLVGMAVDFSLKDFHNELRIRKTEARFSVHFVSNWIILLYWPSSSQRRLCLVYCGPSICFSKRTTAQCPFIS